MLVTTKEMLRDAQLHHYAVGAFNVENLEFVMAVIRAAEDKKSPVIMQTTPGTIQFANLEYFKAIISAAAAHTKIPVAMHVDHGDSFSRCMQALRVGYTSIMIDGSKVPFRENVSLTRSVTKVALPMGIPVEAELGRVGGKEDDMSEKLEGSPFTDPTQAEAFVGMTHCSSLAVGVGTAHGVYKGAPHIEQGILCEIRKKVEVPLVLHGTSGVPDKQVAEAIQNGICKVNYATELRQAFTHGFMKYMSNNPKCFDPKKPSIEGMKEIYSVVTSHMDNLGSTGKA